MFPPIHTRFALRLAAPLFLALFTLAGFGAAPGPATGEVLPTGGLSSDPVVVFVVWGSSNACGQGRLSLSPVPDPGTAWMAHRTELLQEPPPLVPLADRFPCGRPGVYASHGSAWPQYAFAYHGTTSHVLFMTSATKGGSWVRQNPAPGENGLDWHPSSNELYPVGKQTITNAMIAAERAFPGHDVVFGGVLWWQGNDLATTFPGGYPWTDVRDAYAALLQRYGEDVTNDPTHRGYGGRFYFMSSPVRRDFAYADYTDHYDYAFDLEAVVCGLFAHCSFAHASLPVWQSYLACAADPGCNENHWYDDDIHLDQLGLNAFGAAAAGVAAPYGLGDPPRWEVGIEVPLPIEDDTPVGLRVYNSDGSSPIVDTIVAPTIASPDWTASFDGSYPGADWSVSWASLGTAFLTFELSAEYQAGSQVIARYVYVPTTLAYGAGATGFYRPQAETGPPGVFFEVYADAGGLRARARAGEGGPYFEDTFAGSYVLPYNHDHLAATCPANCPSEPPGFFLAPVSPTAPLPTTATQRYAFAAEADVLLRHEWGTDGVLAWDVPGLELAFPAGRRLLAEGGLQATGVTLTEAVTGEGWGGLVFRHPTTGEPPALYPSTLTGVVVEHVRRPPPQGMFAVPYGAVAVHGREVTLDDTEVVSSVGGITGLLVSGAAEVTVSGGSDIRENTGGGIFATGGATVTVSESFVLLNTGGAGVAASGYGTLVRLGGATVSNNTGVGVESRSQATVLFASDEADPGTTVENNLGGLDAGGGSQLIAGVCGPTSCGDRPEHLIRFNNPSDAYFDARSLSGSYLTAQGNDWGVSHLDDLVLVDDLSSWLEVCPLVGAGGCGIDGRLAGGAHRSGEPGGSDPPLRLSDVLALVDEAERARMDGDMEAFAIAATAAVAAIDTSRAEDDRRAAFEVTARLFAWAQPAGPLAALEALAQETTEGRPWALRALGVAYASGEDYDDARAIADTLASAYAGGEHAAFGHGLAVRVAVADRDEAGAVAALLALADAFPGDDALGALAALVVGAFPDADLSALMGGGEAAPAPPASATASDVPGALLAVEAVRPNPASGSASVPFALSAEAEVEAVLYDVLGRRLAVLASGAYGAGRHALTLGGPLLRRLPSGVYVVRVTAEGSGPASVAVRPFTLTR